MKIETIRDLMQKSEAVVKNPDVPMNIRTAALETEIALRKLEIAMMVAKTNEVL